MGCIQCNSPGFPCVVVLIGPAGSGKSTLASTWEPTQVLGLDHYRALVSDSAGDQSATGDAVFALLRVLEARLRRGLTSVIDATSTNPDDRATLLATARRYGVPTAAVIVPTPLDVCLERNAARTGDRHVPEDTVRAQHQAMVATASPARLRHEGFDYAEFAPSLQRLNRLGVLLRRVSDARRRELGLDGGDGVDNDERLLRRFFGPEIARLATWKDGSGLVTGEDRVVVLEVAGDYRTLAFRRDADGEGNYGFDILVPCPTDAVDEDERCGGPAWLPAYSATDLLRAYEGQHEIGDGLVCEGCGYESEIDHETADWEAGADQGDDPEGRADLQAQYAEAVRP
ncbi:ATP-binding protein [Streptomyces sp. TRM68367]|uniref:ATP-binding protein n=1 Tax=Streptomyces sp. TRM68367 TaxID=2758415 RepID=UPI00165B8F39|nr:ATP-binding protein [Streptomyces sp. TRM68367]MBC9730987.1 AAA family ATPase [Streptomyces sp. TRM68367]